jgi:hypothetical protein
MAVLAFTQVGDCTDLDRFRRRAHVLDDIAVKEGAAPLRQASA